MIKRLSLIASLLLVMAHAISTQAQELNCQVQVITPKLQTADPKIFKTLETSIYDFMNSRKWTSDIFEPEERIECSILINITEELSIDKFKAQVSIQSSRSVHNSSYNSVVINHVDKDWVFQYAEYQPLEFNENVFISNLTSMLAFYAYFIIGMDYDTYSLKGGTPYFTKAQAIVNSIPPNLGKDEAPGWKPFDGNRNRYWIVENLLKSRYEPFRSVAYKYHLQGLDMMYENPKVARQVITSALKTLKEPVEENPNAMIVQLFFNAKAEELVNIYSGASPPEKAAIVQLLNQLDPTNKQKYQQIMKK